MNWFEDSINFWPGTLTCVESSLGLNLVQRPISAQPKLTLEPEPSSLSCPACHITPCSFFSFLSPSKRIFSFSWQLICDIFVRQKFLSPCFLHESPTLNIYDLGQGEDIYTYIFRDMNRYRFSVHSHFFDIIRTVQGHGKTGGSKPAKARGG